MDDDFALDPIRDDPAYAELMKPGHPGCRYAAVWSTEAITESIGLDASTPDLALRRARDLAREGYRPVAWSAAQAPPDGELLTASAWHRPVVGEAVKDRLAERQARAAVALVRLDQAEAVWPLLRHSADPRLRSFIVNRLKPLGADPTAAANELTRPDSTPRPAERREGGWRPREGSAGAESQGHMDAILFQRETSIRRALILALGTYANTDLSPGEREPLAARLLDLYENDPDAGIHGAAEWTLRKWGQAEKLTAIDASLPGLKNRGSRRWFVNGQGQTFALIGGPVEFRMGSPPTETERFAGNEPPRRMVIPRQFALATKEVSVAQCQRFLKEAGITIDQYQLPPSSLQKFSPDPDGPWIAPDWYAAAHYCNWLSEQEGLPREEWCYLPAPGGGYAEGMSIPANVLERTGYRLPTEAEWEYACRSGTLTARYYGLTTDLLGEYAWYQANSHEHAWRCGSRQPNDLGLFDMLGNVFEWTNDATNQRRPIRHAASSDNINIISYIMERNTRILRGGTFYFPPAFVRSAFRVGDAPSFRNPYFGFRPSRTYY
jgi:formylglycine-generating enzyme required for sulfatase activity